MPCNAINRCLRKMIPSLDAFGPMTTLHIGYNVHGKLSFWVLANREYGNAGKNAASCGNLKLDGLAIKISHRER